MAGLCPEEHQDLRKRLFPFRGGSGAGYLPCDIIPDIGRNLPEYLFDREDVRGKPALDRARRHPVIFRGCRILYKGNPSCSLHRPETECAVGPAAGKNDCYRLFLLVLCQGPEEGIYRHSQSPQLGRKAELEHTVKYSHLAVWRNDIDVVRLNRHLVCGLDNRYSGNPLQDLREHACVAGIEMGNQDKRHPAVGRDLLKENLKRLEAAGRCTNGDDRKTAFTTGFFPLPGDFLTFVAPVDVVFLVIL